MRGDYSWFCLGIGCALSRALERGERGALGDFCYWNYSDECPYFQPIQSRTDLILPVSPFNRYPCKSGETEMEQIKTDIGTLAIYCR
jgi:hypothetical protein